MELKTGRRGELPRARAYRKRKTKNEIENEKTLVCLLRGLQAGIMVRMKDR